MSIMQMKMSSGQRAHYMRSWLAELAPEEKVPASVVANAMAERFPHVSYGTLKRYWQELKGKGMVASRKGTDRGWLYWLTEDGEEFWKWMMNTEEGRAWGKADGSGHQQSTKRKEEKPYFQGGLINTHLPTEPIVMDNVSANQHGLLLAYVPAGVDIVWVEEIEQEDGSVKKKPHKIKRKSEEKVLTEAEQLKARLRELGEDI